MKFAGAPVLATLALTATYLPGILAGNVGIKAYGRRGEVANVEGQVANYTAIANGTEAVNVGQGEENADDANAEENVDEENNADAEQNADEQNADEQNADEQNADEQNADEQNADEENQNNDQNIDEENLQDLENQAGIDINENDVQGSLQQNILELMLSMGVCNFNIGSIAGLGINSQVQLLLQLQQLAQLQQLGIVNAVSIDQLIQQEILLNNFNLNIIKRTVNASVSQAARGKRRSVLRRECKNSGNQ
ncbi:hypothetical protein F5B20DRAFT_184072 [Whalleya microplaca]|nr:hypothetical protein F5B20DRAFT_184072 [Whalleya microplaca]